MLHNLIRKVKGSIYCYICEFSLSFLNRTTLFGKIKQYCTDSQDSSCRIMIQEKGKSGAWLSCLSLSQQLERMCLWHFYKFVHSGRLTEKAWFFFFLFWINSQDNLHFRNHVDILIIKMQLCATVLVRVYKTMICLMNLADLCWWLGCFFASCRPQWSWKSHYILLNNFC